MRFGAMVSFCLGVGVLPGAAAEVAFDDDFALSRARYHQVGSGEWRRSDGRCQFNLAHDASLLLNVESAAQIRVEARLTIERRRALGGFVMAGLQLWENAENHWRLLLVAAPDGKTYFELCERLGGVHQANLAETTRLAAKREGDLTAWRYEQPYQLVLTLRADAIVGEVRDSQSNRLWRQTISLGDGPAVRIGRPGLTGDGTAGRFERLTVRGQAPSTGVVETPSGRAGSVAVVADEAGRVAPVLAKWLEGAGFGAVVVPWAELAEKRLSAAQTDLVVLADARRVPATIAQECQTYLGAQGKLLALGAPAFGVLLVHTPGGYVSQERYGETMFDHLSRRPLPLQTAAWRRGAKDMRRPSSIEPLGSGAPSGWRAVMDYDAWDHFGQAIAGGFSGGHDLLCFRAKGDAETPQLSIECKEKDGSRWIATVALTTEFRSFVLRRDDFHYWRDSKAKRGWAGDRFRPANAADILFGLSAGHTPACRPGKRSFAFEQVSTAVDPRGSAAAAIAPDIECLAPSYRIYPLAGAAQLRPAHGSVESVFAGGKPFPFSAAGYAPALREEGQGFGRERAFRYLRLLDVNDASGAPRGALLWLAVGDNSLPGAVWGGLGLADPYVLLRGDASADRLRQALLTAVGLMTEGTFLLEAGARRFSYRPGEPIELGALAANYGRNERTLEVRLTVSDRTGQVLKETTAAVTIPPGDQRSILASGTAAAATPDAFPLTIATELRQPGTKRRLDALEHAAAQRLTLKSGRADFVKVHGSQFMLAGKPWCLQGINFWPNKQGGRNSTRNFQRATYEPDTFERDLAWLQSVGVNCVSGVQGPSPADPAAPDAFADVVDFLDRCQRRNIKVFYFLPEANPLAGGSVERVKQHIEAAGIRHHPAILAWELSWEPIYYSGPRDGKMDFLIPDWNAWIGEQYGSLAAAERDWNCKLPRSKQPGAEETAALPPSEWNERHGPWQRAAAAFRRFFSDRVGRAYGDMIRELRRYDPDHLVSFRFGACGLPQQNRFAHAHSVGVAKHVDFLCPEGYILQPQGPARPTSGDEIRSGGLTTLYYRFLAREKPVVWMEFGYSVNGMHKQWKTGDERIAPQELRTQRQEYEKFFAMFLESGARGAAPWWLPGGFRVGENSDFGILEPDGAERPACEVLRRDFPRLAAMGELNCIANAQDQGRDVLRLDPSAYDADYWQGCVDRYLEAVKTRQSLRLGTPGTGTTSANAPLTAVGGGPCTGANPPLYLNAQFNEVEFSDQRSGRVRFRASVGNTGEATWLAKGADGTGRVSLHCAVRRTGEGHAKAARDDAAHFEFPLPADTPYLSDVAFPACDASLGGEASCEIELQLLARRTDANGRSLRLPFGEKRRFTLRLNGQ